MLEGASGLKKIEAVQLKGYCAPGNVPGLGGREWARSLIYEERVSLLAEQQDNFEHLQFCLESGCISSTEAYLVEGTAPEGTSRGLDICHDFGRGT